MLIDKAAVLVEQFYRDSSFGSRGGNVETALHVLHDLQRRSAQRNRFDVRGWTRRDWLGFRNSGRGRSGGSARFATCSARIAIGFHDCDWRCCFGAVAGRLCCARAVAEYFTEVGPPGVVDELRIATEPLEQGLHVLGVRAKFL